MAGRLDLYSTLVLSLLVAVAVVFAVFDPVSLGFIYSASLLANVAGFLALFLIGGTGAMMVFKQALVRRFRNPEGLRVLHVWLAAAGGAFLVIHVVFFLLFPLTLPVLWGYAATYVAFAIWVAGLFFLEGLRGSLFYHSLLSLVGVALILLHVFSAGGDVPIAISGLTLVAIAAIVLGSALRQFVRLSRESAPRT